ncbi:gamma carbonic anhydrase family protein [Metallumcola ferriviriculae]|uniref:Gamma carbonic anhydrase family protein n=1 Tax=Metallumcola ferriviriculae TaxID=3039180 RepID=A0AAU0UN31_9FIRM|nr:gamma carbonic anhydrase family protein [Desulfitibacteraceae bacterium MK1]
MLIEFNGKKPKVAKGAFVAPNATLIGDVTVEEGASIWFGAQLRGDFGGIIIGANSSIQDNAVVHVLPKGQTVVEENVTVAHGAVLHNCVVREGSIIGMNVVILDNAEVGEQAMIAAGSVVATGSKIPDRYLAAGAPAKPKKELSGESLWWVEASAKTYVDLANDYLKQGIGKINS